MANRVVPNPFRGAGLGSDVVSGAPMPSVDATAPGALMGRCPAAAVTPLEEAPGLAQETGISTLWIKDETGRMGLGSFKALGAAYVIARAAAERSAEPGTGTLAGETYVTASAGNHGLSVAAGARKFGARAVIYLAETVPEGFAARLREKGAEVVRAGTDYETSMAAALAAAEANGWMLLSDSSWPGYMVLPHRLMEGYLVMAAEIAQRIDAPSHVFLQAGVGGMAGAVSAYLRAVWGDGPRIVVVEPAAAPALTDSIWEGKPAVTQGPVSNMGRLDCKEPSLIALAGLARDADDFVTVSDAEGTVAVSALASVGIETTPSGGAGFAALMQADLRAALGISPDARVLIIVSEGADG